MNWPAWRHYLRLYDKPASLAFLALVAAGAQVFLAAGLAYLMRHMFDAAIPSGQPSLIALTGAGVFLVFLASSAALLMVKYFVLKAAREATSRLRRQIVDKCYAMPRSRYAKLDVGALHGRIVQDSQRVEELGRALGVDVLPAVMLILALAGAVVWLNPWLLVGLLAVAVPLHLVTRPFGRSVHEETLALRQCLKNFSSRVLFMLQMLDLTHTRSCVEQETDRQARTIYELRDAGWAVATKQAAFDHAQKLVIAAVVSAFLILGGWAVKEDLLTIGDLLAFLAIVALLRNATNTLYGAFPTLVHGAQSFETVHRILCAEDSHPYSGGTRIAFQGAITMDRVSFGYGEKVVIRDLTLSCQPGTTLALVGPSGCGKSTVVLLMLGFYRPLEGRLLADGLPYDDLDIPYLRGQIGVAAQQPMLFAGSIRENIAYGSPEADLGTVVWAARLSLAHEFITALPDGYDTPIGEHGILLSGGQRQRLALARALITKPRLLILDEPTNHLDRHTVHRLMQNIRNLEQRPAIVLITHDRGILGDADHVHDLECLSTAGATSDIPVPL